MKKIQELIGIGVVGALVGAFLGLLLYLFEPIGGSGFTDTVLVLALAGAISVSLTVWIISGDKY